jgi:isopentenyl-diphosphate Delta-isomerase
MTERVVLVNEADEVIGTGDKYDVHVAGVLHRAISVFVFDTRGRMLLQRRAVGKYHSGGLWSNTCCSHPRPAEPVAGAAHRRLLEEMGFSCPLWEAFAFTYRADVGGGLIEHEYDRVFVGSFDGDPAPDPREADDWRWLDPAMVARELHQRPRLFTTWFHLAFDELRRRGYLDCLSAPVPMERSHEHQQLQPGYG